jgi:hypothetical protein
MSTVMDTVTKLADSAKAEWDKQDPLVKNVASKFTCWDAGDDDGSREFGIRPRSSFRFPPLFGTLMRCRLCSPRYTTIPKRLTV